MFAKFSGLYKATYCIVVSKCFFSLGSLGSLGSVSRSVIGPKKYVCAKIVFLV